MKAKKINSGKVNFQLGVDIQVAEQQKKIILTSLVQIYFDETQTELLGSIRTKGEYVIENFSEMIGVSNGVPLPTMASLAGIQISTTRGMLKLLSAGTDFEEAIIPIINPMAFFTTPQQKKLIKST